MTAKQAFTIFMFAALATCLKCGPPTFKLPRTQNITKFYSRNSKIWTVNTTETTNVTCKLDTVTMTTANYTDFNRQVTLHGQTSTTPLRGTFTTIMDMGAQNISNAMIVGPEGALATSTERLVNAYGGSVCGIFFVSYMSGPYHYEIRVKNKALQQPNEKCVKKFQELAMGSKKNITTMYQQFCKPQ
uniref:Putative group i salivary lipocalin n=1 Tax=Rhipicephalus pulchellus TaxID=72859 RepID=L7LR25_RHIPC